MVWHHLKICECSLQERRQRTKRRHPQPSRGGVFIFLNLLKPDAGADLVPALHDLDAVRISKQVAAIPHAGVHVSARCGNSSAGDGDRSRLATRDKRQTRGERGVACRVVIKGPARKTYTYCVQDRRRDHVRFLNARDLEPPDAARKRTTDPPEGLRYCRCRSCKTPRAAVLIAEIIVSARRTEVFMDAVLGIVVGQEPSPRRFRSRSAQDRWVQAIAP